MTARIRLKQGDICLFNFNPSVGHEFQGKRPALVVESDEQILKSNLVTVMPLTSNLDNCLPDDILVARDSVNRLIADSVIKVYSIISLDYARLVNKIGSLDAERLGEVKSYLKKHFSL